MSPAMESMVALAAFASCLDVTDPDPRLVVQANPLRLTDAGLVVAKRLEGMAAVALEGPAGWDWRSELWLAYTAFRSKDAEAVCAAARMLRQLHVGLEAAA